ncbi:hypothetical protein EBB07_24720 [Paenibacillaceae bacterium]|nr:hypothetical protein EBB07_24720 [Paenibacillaceae bacterium]
MSNLHPCPECNHSIADSATNCPNCGANLEEEENPFLRIVTGLVFMAFCLAIGWIVNNIIQSL